MVTKKNASNLVLITFSAAVVAGIVFYANKAAIVNPASQAGSTLSAGERALITKDWELYQNDNLGIAFKHPKIIEDGEMVFFQVGNVVFVTTASSTLYIHRNEFQQTPQMSEDVILQNARKITEKYPMDSYHGSWQIQVHEASSDDDLNRIIQNNVAADFSGGCKLGEKVRTSQYGVFDIGIVPVKLAPDPGDISASSCYINWRGAFKYSPYYHRAATWKIGQEEQFQLTGCNTIYDCDADTLMAESFRFIERK